MQTARETPPALELVEVPEWTEADPATELIGEWTDPVSLERALTRLEALKAERRLRIVELGQLYAEIRDHDWVWMMGFDSLRELAKSVGMSLRTLQRYAHLVDCFELHPALAAAFEAGMDLGGCSWWPISPRRRRSTTGSSWRGGFRLLSFALRLFGPRWWGRRRFLRCMQGRQIL